MQVYETPVLELPVSPAGAQNAPGVTINELLFSTGAGVGVLTGAVETVGVGVGVADGVITGVGVIVGVALTVGVGVTVGVALTVGVGVTVGVELTVGVGVGVLVMPRPQESINVFNFVASFVSTVKEYLTFIAIQFTVYVHCSLAGNQRAGSLSPLERLVESVTAINARASLKSFAYA